MVGGTTAVVGRVAGALNNIGIDDDFMRELGYTLETGTSSLFVLVIRATADRVLEELKQFEGSLLQTSLSGNDEEALVEALEPRA